MPPASAWALAWLLAAPPSASHEPDHEPDDTATDGAPSPGAFNTCDRQPAGKRFRITLPEQAELSDLVRWMTTVSCRKFIWNPAVRGGKVTIIAPEPVTVQQAYAAFDSALESMGLTTEASGEYWKIVETTGIAGRNLPVLGPDEAPTPGDRFVTRLIRPEHADPAEVAGILAQLRSDDGQVERAGDLVIVTDTASNVGRLLDVLAQIDLSPDDDLGLFVHTLAHADPEEVESAVLEIFGPSASEGSARPPAAPRGKSKSTAGTSGSTDTTTGGSSAGSAVRQVVVDVRSRALVLVARKADLGVVRSLIERLDQPIPGQAGQLRIVRLTHADPEEVANVIGSLGKGKAAATDGKTPAIRGEISVTADPATRSLLIDATAHDFENLRPVIAALDVERKQLYIEIYLLEVTVDRKLNTGASGHFGKDTGNGDVAFVKSTPAGTADSTQPFAADLAGLAAGILGHSIGIPGLGQEIPSFGVVLQALASDSDVNVVSEPHIYAADNKMAKIAVGQKVPIQSGVTYPGGAGGNSGLTPVANYTREPVQLQIEVTPHVNDDHEVTLDVKLTDSEIEAIEAEGLVTTSERSIELEDVIARDGQPVVLGGLVKDTERVGNSKIPGLGSIPLLGWLFRSHRRERKKLNLLVVLVPHILDSPEDAHRIHARRMQERREFLERESAFKRRDLATHIDYRKTSGLLASIDAEARKMTTEAEEIHRARDLLDAAGTEEIGPEGVTRLPPPAGIGP